MQKTLLILATLGCYTMLNAIDINKMKWASDFELLVNLSANVENTIEGLDQNTNGIRDDVEYYVNAKYKDRPFQKAMFIKAAHTIQKIITLSTDDIKIHQKLDNELLNLYTCRDYILYKMDDDSLEKELQDKIIFKGKVLNTEKRLLAYVAHKQLLPLKFEELSDARLKKDKQTCVNQYNKYKNLDENLISSTN